MVLILLNESDLSRNLEKITVSQYLKLAFWSLCSNTACLIQVVQILVGAAISYIHRPGIPAHLRTWFSQSSKCSGEFNIKWPNSSSLALGVSLWTDSRHKEKFALWIMKVSTSFQVLLPYSQKKTCCIKLSKYFSFLLLGIFVVKFLYCKLNQYWSSPCNQCDKLQRNLLLIGSKSIAI